MVTILAKYILSLSIKILSYDLLVNKFILLEFNRLVIYNIPKAMIDVATNVNVSLFISSVPYFWIIIFEAIKIVDNGTIPKFISKLYIGIIFNVIIFDKINVIIIYPYNPSNLFELSSPVTIKNVTGSGAELIDASKTIYLKISRVINFYSLENDYRASSNFVFEDSQMEDLTNYTIEFKVYPQTLGTGTAGDNQIQRVLAVEGAKEEEANMFRFGESGLQRNQLQWILPGGRAASNTLFSNNKWYLVSCTYDGSNFVMYVNGVKDVEAAGSGKHTPFQRFEYGMSWGGGYPSGQFFNGRLAEVRVWNRALGASEIVGGLCGVDPKSEGLVAYWKMNQQSGTTILDVTGHGYDMDWTKSKRDKRENGVMADTPDAANYLKWIYDENNKCAQ